MRIYTLIKLLTTAILSMSVMNPAQADVVVVVSVRNPESSLTKEQVAQIFLGKTATFPSGMRAIPIDQAENSTLRNEFYRKTTGWDATLLKVYWSRIIFTSKGRPPMEVPDDEMMKSLLRRNPSAIGYIDKREIDDSIKVIFIP